MSINLNLNIDVLKNPESSKMHLLPFHIDHDGPANVSKYFNTYIKSSTTENGKLCENNNNNKYWIVYIKPTYHYIILIVRMIPVLLFETMRNFCVIFLETIIFLTLLIILLLILFILPNCLYCQLLFMLTPTVYGEMWNCSSLPRQIHTFPLFH